jgi:hypothetical protein
MGPTLGASTDLASGTDVSEDPTRAREDSIGDAVVMGTGGVDGALLQALITSAITRRTTPCSASVYNIGSPCSDRASIRLDIPPPRTERLPKTIRDGIEDFSIPSHADVTAVDLDVMHQHRTLFMTTGLPSDDTI